MAKGKIKKRIVNLLVFVLVGFIANSMYGKDYYVSNGGNDKADGLSPETSIRTLERVNSLMLKPGDNVFFKSGDIFTGTLLVKFSGTHEKPITYTSYGGAEKPVLSGSKPVSGITRLDKNMYSAPCEYQTKYFYLDGKLLTIAREPNQGFFTMDGGGIDYLVDFDLNLDKEIIVGSTVRMRVTNWNYEYREAIDFQDFKIKFDSMLYNTAFKNYKCKKGFGYYLDNKKAFLDTSNESYWSPHEQKVFFISSAYKRNSEIRASVVENGILIKNGVSNIIIKDLILDGFIENGIIAKGNNKNVYLENSIARNIIKMGFFAETGCDSIYISNNELYDIHGTAIRLKAPGYSVIQNNDVKRIGLVAGYGVDGINGAIGISIENIPVLGLPPEQLTNNNIVRDNLVDSTGYMCARMDGFYNIFERNIVKNGLLTMNDGGLIHTYGEDTRDGINMNYTYDNVIRDNIFMNCYGNTESSPGDHKIIHGIYLDARSNRFVIENNIVVNCGGGILLNDKTRDCVVRNNVVYGNNYSGALNVVQNNQLDSLNHSISNNILFNTQNMNSTMALTNNSGTSIVPGRIDSNLFVSPNEKFHIKEVKVDDEWKNTREYTVEGWGKDYKQEGNRFFSMDDIDGDADYRSDIFINETGKPREVQLNPRFEYIDLEGEYQEEILTLPPRGSKILFYKAKE
ncbi:MAG: hypothetical protein ACLFUC_09030 [Bacteroidales bacterium]